MGIEPTYSAWEADVLPLNYTRKSIVFVILPLHPNICKSFLMEDAVHTIRHLRIRVYQYYSQSLSKLAAIASAVSVVDMTSRIVFP